MNPTVVMTDLGKRFWDDPAKRSTLLARTPQGKFAGEYYVDTSYIVLQNTCIILI